MNTCCADYVAGCRLPSAERNLLKDLLVNVVAGALYYNPALALQELQQQNRLTTFFSTWFQACLHSHAAVTAVLAIKQLGNMALIHARKVRSPGVPHNCAAKSRH